MFNRKKKETARREVERRRIKVLERFLQEWDPLGVIEDLLESGIPLDEYDGYAFEILQLLEKGGDREAVEKRLGHIQTIAMGLGPNPPKDSKIAQAVWLWWEREMRDSARKSGLQVDEA